jgi:hypothetical protein
MFNWHIEKMKIFNPLSRTKPTRRLESGFRLWPRPGRTHISRPRYWKYINLKTSKSRVPQSSQAQRFTWIKLSQKYRISDQNIYCEYINSCIHLRLQIRPLVLTNPLTCITTHSISSRPPASHPRISTSKQKNLPEMFSPLEQSTCQLRGGTGLTTTSDRLSPPLSNFPAESKSGQQ